MRVCKQTIYIKIYLKKHWFSKWCWVTYLERLSWILPKSWGRALETIVISLCFFEFSWVLGIFLNLHQELCHDAIAFTCFDRLTLRIFMKEQLSGSQSKWSISKVGRSPKRVHWQEASLIKIQHKLLLLRFIVIFMCIFIWLFFLHICFEVVKKRRD